MAQIDVAGQQDTDNQNAEALQAALAQRQVTLQAQPQGGSDVPIHQNSDPVSDESEILRSCQPLTGNCRVPWGQPRSDTPGALRGKGKLRRRGRERLLKLVRARVGREPWVGGLSDDGQAGSPILSYGPVTRPASARSSILRTPEGDRPSRAAIWRRLRPSSRFRVRTRCSAAGSWMGRPRRFPFALAFASPARTRSTITSRSNSAKEPMT